MRSEKEKKIKTLVIADDHRLFIEGIKTVIAEEPWISWAGAAYTAKETIEIWRSKKPDLLLLDYYFPDGKGMDVAKEILAENTDTAIIMLSMEDDNDIIYACKSAGVMGYLIKNLSSDELLEAIEQVSLGIPVFMWGTEKRAGFEKPADLLSKREKEIVHWVRNGLTSQEIAAKLFLSVYTVDTHRRNILRKLDLKNTAMMVHYAQQHQL